MNYEVTCRGLVPCKIDEDLDCEMDDSWFYDECETLIENSCAEFLSDSKYVQEFMEDCLYYDIIEPKHLNTSDFQIKCVQFGLTESNDDSKADVSLDYSFKFLLRDNLNVLTEDDIRTLCNGIFDSTVDGMGDDFYNARLELSEGVGRSYDAEYDECYEDYINIGELSLQIVYGKEQLVSVDIIQV